MQRSVEQPYRRAQKSCGTIPCTPPRCREFPRHAIRFAGGYRQGAPHGCRHPFGTRTGRADRNDMETGNGPAVPSQRYALRGPERRKGRRGMDHFQRRGRSIGQRAYETAEAGRYLSAHHHRGDTEMVPGRRQNVLGIRGRLRRTRHLGVSLHDMDDDVRNHRTRTEQRRRPARRTEGTAQSQHLYGQSQKFQRLAQQPVETLCLCARHLRGECGGRYRGDSSDMRFERRRTCGALQHRPKPRNTDGTDTARTRNGRPLRKYRQNQRIHLRRGGRVPGRGGG